MSPDDSRSERPGENEEARVGTDHGATGGRSSLVTEENQGERLTRDLGAALDAWRETANTTSLRRALVRVLATFDGDDPESGST